jgi:hypothetical protein
MVINPFYNTISKTFDQVEHAFEGASGQRRIGTLMVAVFLLGLNHPDQPS